MKDPLAGKYKQKYKSEYALAEKLLAQEPGHLEWATHDYQAFIFKGPKVCLVFYPHKTTAGHHHIRVRDQGSKDKARAEELMYMMHIASGSCTFSFFGWKVQRDDEYREKLKKQPSPPHRAAR